MGNGDNWHDTYSHDEPAGQGSGLQPPPAEAASGSTSSGGSGIAPATFLTYVSIGFGCTIGLIAIGAALWLIARRVLRRRQDRRAAATTVSAAAHDPRRAQAEAVHRMIQEKRLAAAAARKPFLVVHPGGDAMVAFKEGSKAAEPAPDPHEQLIKSYLGGSRGSGDTISLTAVAAGAGAAELAGGASGPHVQQAAGQGAQRAQQEGLAQLMGRRALVAAAALSGRTSSGLADMLAAHSPTAEAAGSGTFAADGQQQQRSLSAAGSGVGQQVLPAAAPLSRQGSLAAPPSTYSRTSSGASSAGEDLALLQWQGRGSGPGSGGSENNV